MQNSVISTRITTLYGTQPSSVIFGRKTANLKSLYGYQTSPVVFSRKTARLAPEKLVSMDPCPHLWYLHAKEGLLDQNYTSL